ncbi:MAG: hypothetical protein H8D78_22695 [Chloroflexi bacterium]|nr:hypothetical protein [Chloroflexota bacterium]
MTDEARYQELEAREAFSPDGRQQLVVLDNAGNPDIYAVDGIHAQRRCSVFGVRCSAFGVRHTGA